MPTCESGQKHGVEIDQVEPSPVVRDDVFGFQVAVRPVVRRERREMCIRDRDDVASLAVDQPHAGPRLNLGAAFVEVARPEELRRNHRCV